MNIPDSIQPVIGWRAWQLVMANAPDKRLCALSNTSHWNLDRKTIAKCVPKRHEAWRGCARTALGRVPPARGCQCGLYAYHTPEPLRGWTKTTGPSGWVVGAVLAWGRMYRHKQQGFRSQYAIPIGFLDNKNPYLDQFCDETGFPLFPDLEGLEAFAFGRGGVQWLPNQD